MATLEICLNGKRKRGQGNFDYMHSKIGKAIVSLIWQVAEFQLSVHVQMYIHVYIFFNW